MNLKLYAQTERMELHACLELKKAVEASGYEAEIIKISKKTAALRYSKKKIHAPRVGVSIPDKNKKNR